MSLLVAEFRNSPQPGHRIFPPQGHYPSATPPGAWNSSCFWEASDTTLCSRVGHTLAQGSENTDLILQNDTQKHSNNQKDTLLGLSFPNCLFNSPLKIYKILPFLYASGSQWRWGWAGEEDSLSCPLGTFLLTFNLSSLSNLLREDVQGSPKWIRSLLLPSLLPAATCNYLLHNL